MQKCPEPAAPKEGNSNAQVFFLVFHLQKIVVHDDQTLEHRFFVFRSVQKCDHAAKTSILITGKFKVYKVTIRFIRAKVSRTAPRVFRKHDNNSMYHSNNQNVTSIASPHRLCKKSCRSMDSKKKIK